MNPPSEQADTSKQSDTHPTDKPRGTSGDLTTHPSVELTRGFPVVYAYGPNQSRSLPSHENWVDIDGKYIVDYDAVVKADQLALLDRLNATRNGYVYLRAAIAAEYERLNGTGERQ